MKLRETKEIFTNGKSYKGLESRIYKQFSKPNNKKEMRQLTKVQKNSTEFKYIHIYKYIYLYK